MGEGGEMVERLGGETKEGEEWERRSKEEERETEEERRRERM